VHIKNSLNLKVSNSGAGNTLLIWICSHQVQIQSY